MSAFAERHPVVFSLVVTVIGSPYRALCVDRVPISGIIFAGTVNLIRLEQR